MNEFDEAHVFGGYADGCGECDEDASPAVEEGEAEDELFEKGCGRRDAEFEEWSAAIETMITFGGVEAVANLVAQERSNVLP